MPLRRVLTAVAMVGLVACGTRTPPRVSTADSTDAPSTEPATSTSTTSTTAPRPRSTDGIQPGMYDAITSCEPNLKGATLDVVAVNGPFAAAKLHTSGSRYLRTLTLGNGRWYDGNHGQAACAPRVDDMTSSGPPPPAFGEEGYSGYFGEESTRMGSMTDGTVGTDGVTLVIGISGSHVTKGSIGGGYWIVLTIDQPTPGVHCGYSDAGLLLHEANQPPNSYPPGYNGPVPPPPSPAHCPKQAPPIS